MLCQECKKKTTCHKLCPQAEKYVNRDHVSQREFVQPEYMLELLDIHIKIDSHSDLASFLSESSINFPFLSPLQNKTLSLFYFGGLSYAEIAWKLHTRESILSKQIYLAKNKIRKFCSDREE